MGYSISPMIVQENQELLALLQKNLREGKTTVIPEVPGELSLSATYYHVHRVLAAAKAYGESESVRALRDSLRVRQDLERKAVVVERKKSKAIAMDSVVTADLLDENAAVAALASYPGTMTLLEFRPSPSFNESDLAASLARAGWTLYPSTKKDLAGGVIAYAVEKVADKKPSGFDILNRHKNP